MLGIEEAESDDCVRWNEVFKLFRGGGGAIGDGL